LHEDEVPGMSKIARTKDPFANDEDLRALATLLRSNDEIDRGSAGNLLGLHQNDVNVDALRESVREAVDTLYDRTGYLR
ncbi:unnamed protein product, partial [Rotaria sp. Silwood1]